jgi:pentafunctional AROM polypeptide
LSLSFCVDLAGKEVEEGPSNHQNGLISDHSIFIIGMRGAGKTTAGGWAADVLCRPLVDLDAHLEETVGMSIPELIHTHGWTKNENSM